MNSGSLSSHAGVFIRWGVACTFLLSCTPSQEVVASIEQAIAGGEFAPRETGVFHLQVQRDAVQHQCSAALIAPDLLLTAAHCVSGQFQTVACDETLQGEPLPVASFRATNEADLQSAPGATLTFLNVEETLLPYSGQKLCGMDLALLRLSQDVPQEQATPIRLRAPNQREMLLAGDAFYAVGYGAGHTSGTGEGIRRSSALQKVTCLGPSECEGQVAGGVAGAPSQTIPTLSAGEFSGDAGACQGDSGGPALILEDSGSAVIGIVSRGFDDCRASIFTSIDRPELRAVIRNHYEANRGEEPPQWALEPEQPDESDSPPSDDAKDTPEAGDDDSPQAADPDSAPEGCSWVAPHTSGLPVACLAFLLPVFFRRRRTSTGAPL